MKIEFWFDPYCPWCWITSRWIIEVAPQRDLTIDWKSISLRFKNHGTQDPSEIDGTLLRTHRLLRVVEAVRDGEGSGPIGELYTEYGRHIHHDENVDFDVVDALESVGLDRSYADALDDESWDPTLHSSMEDALSVAGDDVGTPILAANLADGGRIGFFGPVISPAPAGQAALDLFDGVIACITTPGLWELKRTRTVGPRFPGRG